MTFVHRTSQLSRNAPVHLTIGTDNPMIISGTDVDDEFFQELIRSVSHSQELRFTLLPSLFQWHFHSTHKQGPAKQSFPKENNAHRQEKAFKREKLSFQQLKDESGNRTVCKSSWSNVRVTRYSPCRNDLVLVSFVWLEVYHYDIHSLPVPWAVPGNKDI